ncbi:MAG: LPS-assembly protein LptD, partial [Bacteroidales bacterium]|nr:LPS-assembly protein LptD [Bacteroidales bacterium]
SREPAFSSQIAEKKVVLPDSLELARRDSIRIADSLFRADSAALMKSSSLRAPAFSAARDSVVENFVDGARMIHYYGDVKVRYQNMELTAERMDYDVTTGVVHAYGVYDSLLADWKGRPVMSEGGKVYNMEELRYNFNTRKARIKNMVTNEDDGILHGRDIKMMPDKSINITNGKYTVCDHEEPHYYLQLTAAKVVTEPSQKIVFGPAYVVIEDVKVYPLVLPFGFVPKRPKRATGILFPTFGEETARGFYMRDLGMYFVFGDYFDLSATGDYYTLGSWAIDLNSRYKVNYRFNGNFSLTYSDDRTGEKGSADYNRSTNFGVRWSHSQDSKAHPGTTFSASVNFSSPSNSRYNSHSVNEALQNQASSSISFSKSFGGKATLSLNALHSQNSRDSSYAFTLPNLTFSVATFYPFKRKNRVGKEKVYEKFSLSYNTSLQNKINFKASEFMEDGFFDRFQNGMTHNFSIGLPSFSLFKYITLSPSVSYGMNWFFRTTEARYDEELDKVVTEKSKAFSHLGITQTYSGSISASTRLYGMYNFGKYHRVQAIRHVVSPSLSMSLSPDLATYANGYRTLTYTDSSNEIKTYEYNIYSGQLYSPPGSGRSATASFSIGNNLEAKVRDFADTTGTGSKKVKLIDQLNIRSGYNFLADSLKLNTISMSMSTSLFGKVSVSASANFDPYAVDSKGRKYNEWAVNMKQGLARFTNASLSLSYSLSGKGAMKGNDGSKEGGGSDSPANYYRRIYTHPYTGEYIPGGWLYYTNPNVPWSVNFSYTFSCNRNWSFDSKLNSLAVKNNITQTLRVNGNIKLTPKMNINASSGYDFQAKQMTSTQLSATYDMHCFNISVSWVPTGTWQSYSFRIQANAAALSDLLRFKKSSSF